MRQMAACEWTRLIESFENVAALSFREDRFGSNTLTRLLVTSADLQPPGLVAQQMV